MQNLVAVLITDLVGSTAFRQRVGDQQATPLIEKAEELQRSRVAAAGGRVTLGTGDGVIAVFDGPTVALDALHLMSEDVRELGLAIRGAIEVGDVSWDEDRPTGPTLTRCIELIDALSGDEIVCSDRAAALMTSGSIEFVSGPISGTVVPTAPPTNSSGR